MEYILILILFAICLALLANNTALKHRYVKRIEVACHEADMYHKQKEHAVLEAISANRKFETYKKDYDKKVKDMEILMSGKNDELMKDQLFHQLQNDYKELEDKYLKSVSPKPKARR